MKRIIILSCILLLISCNNERNKYNQETIKQFENILGKQETIYLNEILCDFNAYLNKKYSTGNLDFKYKTYLKEFSKLRMKDYWKIDSIKLIKYQDNSNLFAKYNTIYLDSIWKESDRSFSYRYKDDTEMDVNSQIYLKNVNIDSIINTYKKKPRYILKEPSNFYIAIDSIKKKDSLLINFTKVKEVLGIVYPEILGKELFANLDNNPSYFSKLLFIMEFNQFVNYYDSI